MTNEQNTNTLDGDNAQKEIKRLEKVLHSLKAHPDYEYTTTTCGRKTGFDGEPDGDGWKVNDDYNDGWERFDYHEETYWKRIK